MRRVTYFGLAGALVGLALSGVYVSADSDQLPPADPDPPQTLDELAPAAANEVLLRAIEMNDLLGRLTGAPDECVESCLKDTAPESVDEFLDNSCRAIQSLSFSETWARRSPSGIASLASSLEGRCDSLDSVRAQHGPIRDSEQWKSAAGDLRDGLQPLIDAAAAEFAEIADHDHE